MYALCVNTLLGSLPPSPAPSLELRHLRPRRVPARLHLHRLLPQLRRPSPQLRHRALQLAQSLGIGLGRGSAREGVGKLPETRRFYGLAERKNRAAGRTPLAMLLNAGHRNHRKDE